MQEFASGFGQGPKETAQANTGGRPRGRRLLAAATSIVLDREGENRAATVHMLKLQWVVTEDEVEKSKISSELRRRLHNPEDK